jgi:hypothetical protein
MPLSLHSGQVMLPRFSEETGAVCCRAMERCRCGTPSASRKRRFHTPVSDNDDDDLHRELAHCQERLLRIEQDLALLGWLPTSYAWTLIEQLHHEHARCAWLWRLISRLDRGTSQDERRSRR